MPVHVNSLAAGVLVGAKHRSALHFQRAARSRLGAAGANSLRRSHQLKDMTIRIFEIQTSAAVPVVELAIVKTPRSAAV